MKKPKMLVHICCAPDALYVMDLLSQEYDVSGFFYNPNIHPQEEYDLRLKEARSVARRLGFPLIEGPYEPSRWFSFTRAFKEEPEKGRRCDVCYAMRLKRTAEEAARLGFEAFATVMSLSPWKKAEVMNRIGRMLGRRHPIAFLEANF
ncbi:MAG: epoxyqueuosine reductase QueH, partial [Candidatus Aminicenantales bacterium]